MSAAPRTWELGCHECRRLRIRDPYARTTYRSSEALTLPVGASRESPTSWESGQLPLGAQGGCRWESKP